MPDGGGRSLRAVTVGTLQEYSTEAAARKSDAVQSIILRLNTEHTLGPVTASTVGVLIARYEKEELPSRYSTRASYQSYLDNYIRPRWGEAAIASVKAMAVEDWLKRLTLAPIAPELAKELLAYRERCYPTKEGWFFANPATEKPYHQEEIQKKHIRRAAKAAGIDLKIGWKTFRHSFRSWLDQTEAPIGVQRELMRHASIQTTMDVYGRAMTDSKRQAQSNVVQMVLKNGIGEDRHAVSGGKRRICR